MNRTNPRIKAVDSGGSASENGTTARDDAGDVGMLQPLGAGTIIQPEVAQLLAEGAPSYVADRNGRIVFINVALRQLAHALGSADDADGVECLFPLHEVMAEAIASDGPVRREDLHKLGDTVLYLTSEHRPLHDPQGRIIAVGGTFHDSNREASAQREALAARERFRDIARLVSDWLWETDAEFNLTYVSARATEILGFHSRYMIGRNLLSLGTFQSENGHSNAPSTDTRSPFRNLLFLIPSAKGDDCLFELSGIPVFDDARGTFRGYRGTARDITAEARARKEAARSQRRLTAAIENISEGFALWGREQRLNLLNPRYRDIFAANGIGLAEGMTFDTFLTRAQAAGFFAKGAVDTTLWRETRAQAIDGDGGMAMLHLADGRWLRISEHRTGNKQAIVTIVSDITELKAREEALVAAKEMAEIANRSKSEFLANMSHEFRTPLNAIIGFSEIMGQAMFGPLGNERYNGYVRDIIRSSHHLLGIINDILEAAKVDAGKLELDEEDIDIAADVRDTVRLLAEQAAQAQVTIAVNADGNLPWLYADRRRIRQIVLNLMSNAIKFTPHGGCVTVELHHRSTGEIALTVADTGIGIEQKDIPKVLAPFGQVEGSLNRRHQGTGLGLPLSRALAELHGGGLSIDSTPGRGTCVTVMFPQTRARSI